MKIKVSEDDRFFEVVQSNEFVRTMKENLSVNEAKLLAYLISKIKPDDDVNQEYSFPLSQFLRTIGLAPTPGKTRQQMIDFLNGFRTKGFDGEDKTLGRYGTGYISYYRVDDGVVYFAFNKITKHILFGLTEGFTKYTLINYIALTSVYSMIIYELSQSYASQHGFSFYIDDLRKKLGAEKYQNFKDFRIRCLDRATEEINRVTDLEVSYTTEKCGSRKVQFINFIVKKKKCAGLCISAANAQRILDKAN